MNLPLIEMSWIGFVWWEWGPFAARSERRVHGSTYEEVEKQIVEMLKEDGYGTSQYFRESLAELGEDGTTGFDGVFIEVVKGQ